MRYVINGFDVPEMDFWTRVNGITTEQQRYMLMEGYVVKASGRVCQIIDDGDDEDEEAELTEQIISV